MNQEKIGKFIAQCRKEKKLTQEELGKKVGVGFKAVSKWENGHNLPDISLMPSLCEVLNVSINDLLNGEKDNNSKNNGVLNYLKYQKKKNKNRIILISIISILILIISILLCYFVNNYGKVKVFEIYGESNNFEYNDSLFLTSNIKHIFVDGKLNIKNDNISYDDIKLISLKSGNDIIKSGTNIFNEINKEDYGYNELFSKNVIDNIDNWYIEISYNNNGNMEIESIRLNNNNILQNDKFINIFKSNINNNNNEEQKLLEEHLKKFNENLQEILKRNNFEYLDDYPNMLVKTLNNNESFMIRADGSQIIYSCNEYRVYSNTSGLSHRFEYKDGNYEFLYEVENEKITCNQDKCPKDAQTIAKKYIELFNSIFK